MTLYAIFSDIHANYAALMAAVRDARALARREHAANLEFISLGDVVDYGPQPNECVAWVQRYASITIQGNHDQTATEPLASPPLEIDQELWPIVLWTRAELRDRNKQALHRWRGHPGASELLTWFTPFHSNIDESGVYLNTARAAKRTLQQLKTPYGLFGHTHMQGYYIQVGPSISIGLVGPDDALSAAPGAMEHIPIDVWTPLPTDGRRVILNPGSVGQPRQQLWYGATNARHDHRAAYMLLRQCSDQSWEARFQRVDYPIVETIRLLRQYVRWDRHQPEIESMLSSHRNAASRHPFSDQLYETAASMDTLLPALIERLIQQLMPNEALLEY
jgi:predicted phosphodiesterase